MAEIRITVCYENGEKMLTMSELENLKQGFDSFMRKGPPQGGVLTIGGVSDLLHTQ